MAERTEKIRLTDGRRDSGTIARFGPKVVVRLGPNCVNPKKKLKSDLKKSEICPILGQSDHLFNSGTMKKCNLWSYNNVRNERKTLTVLTLKDFIALSITASIKMLDR